MSTPDDPIKGEYITFNNGTPCVINHIAMQRTVGATYGTVEAKGTQVQQSSYNPPTPDHFGSLFYDSERPSGD